ncbi:MAG: hypothetical protein RSD35_09050 [Oscillospiraceae bacterium]
MEAFWAAVIAAATTIICTGILYKTKLIKIQDNTCDLKEKSKELSEEHDKLFEGHTKISAENQLLLSKSEAIDKSCYEIKTEVLNTAKAFVEEKAKQEFRYSNLTDKQKNIADSINSITAMGEELKRLQSEIVTTKELVKSLESQNELLKSRNHDLIEKSDSFETKVTTLIANNKDLSQQCETLKSENKNLKSAQQQQVNPKNKNRDHER